jgi:glycosyltransferase involved in cell wall biosynthesis
MTPAVSVCLPTHNRPQRLRNAIESVLAGTFQDFEICIADDGEKESAEGVARSFGDPRVRYAQRPSTGIADNWTAACAMGRGAFIAKLDDDDAYEPDFLQETVGFLQAHRNVAVVYPAHAYQWNNGRRREVIDTGFWKGRNRASGFEVARALLLNQRYPRHHKSIGLVRREVGESVGWFQRARLDLTFSLLVGLGHEVGYIPAVLFRYAMHGEESQGMGVATYRELLSEMQEFFDWPEVRRHPEMMALAPHAHAAWRFAFPAHYLVYSFRYDSWSEFTEKWQVTSAFVPDFGPRGLIVAMMVAARFMPEAVFAWLVQAYSRSSVLPALLNRLRGQ